jgi:hypothetical protein
MIFALSLIALAASSAAARDAGVQLVSVDAVSAARLAAAFGTVTSTYRSVEHNRLVGGVPNSYHLSGRAIDIARRPGITHRQIAAALQRAGYRLVESLDEGDHSHFAFGPPTASPIAGPIATHSAQPQVEPQPRIERPLLADQHGVLILDLRAATSAPGRSGSGK